MNQREIYDAALGLPDDEREALGEELLGAGDLDPAVREAWAVELRRRLSDIDAGKVQMIPAGQAMEVARARLRERRARRAS